MQRFWRTRHVRIVNQKLQTPPWLQAAKILIARVLGKQVRKAVVLAAFSSISSRVLRRLWYAQLCTHRGCSIAECNKRKNFAFQSNAVCDSHRKLAVAAPYQIWHSLSMNSSSFNEIFRIFIKRYYDNVSWVCMCSVCVSAFMDKICIIPWLFSMSGLGRQI